MKRRVRQTDVARLAGVSPTTVSLVINNRTGDNVRIPAETRERVLSAVDELGYVVDPAARSLAGGQNSLLGVFTFEAIFPLIHRDFYYRFLVGIEEEAEQQGYDLLLFTSAGSESGQRHIYKQGVNRLRMADGAILLGIAEDKQEVERLVDEGYPFVFVGRRELPGRRLSYVAADYVAATEELVGHMIAAGHRRIGYLGLDTTNESQVDRRLGYRLAHERAGLTYDPSRLQTVSKAEVLTPEVIHSMLADGITAFVLETGPVTDCFPACMEALQLTPPYDLSVATMGDPMEGSPPYADMTAFSIPRRAMGAHAVRIMAEILAHPAAAAPRHITLPCKFVPGSTLAAPPVRQ